MGDNYKDLEELARSTTEDYYELLAVPFDAEESVIKRAYRKASIRYHPDKNPDNKDAADRFIALGWARDILIDPKLKGEYDRARTRRREKAFQDELLTGNRRKMKEELEQREREGANLGASLKRKRAADLNEAEKRELKIQQLAEDGKRRRLELQAKREQARKDEEAAAAAAAQAKSPEVRAPRPGESAELDRTVKIRFERESESAAWDKDVLRSMFEKYGKTDSIITFKDKKLKLEGEKHRKLVATAFVVYGRIDHAHAAVCDAKVDYPALELVAWANGEPDLSWRPSASANSASVLSANPEMATTPATPAAKSFRTSFGGSLGAGNSSTPLGTPKFSFSPKTPSLEEITMMRLKNAEKKRLEDQIRKDEAAEVAREAAS